MRSRCNFDTTNSTPFLINDLCSRKKIRWQNTVYKKAIKLRQTLIAPSAFCAVKPDV